MSKYCLLVCLLIVTAAAHAQTADYKNPRLPINQRVANLLARMTVEEKVAQLQTNHANNRTLTEAILANPAKMDSIYSNGLGMINPAFDASKEQVISRRNALQQYLKTKTRLGIPVIFIDEAHHGLLAREATVFPHGIGLSCSWDTALLRNVYSFIARQSAIRGTNLVLTPVVDVCRDPRWGRTGETLGEDPFLTGLLGSAMVQGFQGSNNGVIAPGHVAATLKHFAGYGQSEGGVNQAPANYSLRTFREAHLESFRLCIQHAKPSSIMASYNEIDGIPAHANKWLLKDVLRGEWGFKGVVVSDWYGIDQLWNKHGVAPNEPAAAWKAFKAGVTLDLPNGRNYRHLPQLVKERKITMAELDSAVAGVLRLKFAMGLFEQGPIEAAKVQESLTNPEGRRLALQAAEESIVLLKNADNLLPLKKDQYKKIAVIGPCAAVNYLGDYSGIPLRNTSLLQGIREKVGGKIEVLYAKGVDLTTNGDTISQNNYQYIDKISLPTVADNQKLISEAVQVAQQSDIIIAAIGENEQFSRESWLADHFGDMSDLNLQSQQEELVKALAATGKPVIVYLVHGRPLSINWINDNIPAIIDGWFMGEEAGHAAANILFGDANPSGKLTITWPRSAGQVPMYYNHKPGAQFFEYVTEKNTPLYPFGHGLSYTTFQYAAPRLSDTVMKKNGRVTVSVEITNTGNRKGEEIVQLYIRQKVASVTRPVKELKGFTRVALAPGEKTTVQFTLDANSLAFWNADMKYAVEPGAIEVMTGKSSVDVQKTNLRIAD